MTILFASLPGCDGCQQDYESRDDGALTVILSRDPELLDPRFVSDPNGLRISRLLFASLVTIEPRTLEPMMDLAESIEMDGETRYRVRLREGLRFSDGSTLDADDVVATFRGIVDASLGARHAHAYRRIVSIERVDALTVVFEIDEPHATFVTDLELPILRAEDSTTRIGDVGGPPPIGAGPFRLESRESGRTELSRNPRWHGEGGDIERVRFVTIRDDNTRALRLRAGAGDLAQGVVPPILVPLLREDPELEVKRADGIGTTYIGVNLEHPVLADRRIRRALAHALDRRALIDAELEGFGTLAHDFIPAGHWASTDAARQYGYDPETARGLIAEAGHDAAGEGPAIRLSLRTGSDRARVSIANAMVAMWREVGVEVEVRPSETATLIADLDAGRFELCLLQLPEVIEPHVLSWFFGSDRIPEPGRAGANRWRYRSEELDAALRAGRVHADREARIDAYREVSRRLSEDLPAIPLWHEDVIAIVRRGIRYPVPRDGRFGGIARATRAPAGP